MRWLDTIFQKGRDESEEILKDIQEKFSSFLTILDWNNRVLAAISDMEEKSQGEYLFDINYIRAQVEDIRSGIGTIIDEMLALGGEQYAALKDRFASIDEDIQCILRGVCPVERDDFTIPFENLGQEKKYSVGSKNAQLGELKSKLNLPTPDGFAITAWAYKHFVDANNIQDRISKRIASVDIKRYEDLERVSADIQETVRSSEVPGDLAEEIRRRCSELAERVSSQTYSLRSSAIGEDTQLSFAGQYATFLNVRARELVERYREVLASKFTPKAIYYFLSHSLTESDLPMSVGCVAMVNSASAGVIYTRDPVRPEDDCILINSIYGLGKYLVDGTLTPDMFRISRKDKSVQESQIVRKAVRLVMREDGGTVDEPVPAAEQERPSLSEDQIRKLAECAMKIEEHYGKPQDIEWAIDRDGKILVLQTRPLRVMKPRSSAEEHDFSDLEVAISGGVTACPGAGAGSVFHAESSRDLPKVPEGAVLFAPNPFAGLITVMGKVKALVTEVGGVASHMATIAREYRIPTLVGLKTTGRSLQEILSEGATVTVDATGGVIYHGSHEKFIEARRPEFDLFEDTPIFTILERVLAKISPLNLIHPSDPGFLPENCSTFHDITRFTHQKAMEEMFYGAEKMEQKERIGYKLKSEIPLQVNVIFIDEEHHKYKGKRHISDEEINSEPMTAFWNGVKKEGWPSTPPANVKGFMSVMATTMTRPDRPEFSENSFAILSREYMIISLRMGYHFTTVEAMCADEPSKNYIRMQYKEGGASLERRIRRINLILEICKKMGFENASKGDFLHTQIAYLDKEAIREKLQLLGRLTIMTKQLDMALTNDAVAHWYQNDFLKKLGLADREEAKQ